VGRGEGVGLGDWALLLLKLPSPLPERGTVALWLGLPDTAGVPLPALPLGLIDTLTVLQGVGREVDVGLPLALGCPLLVAAALPLLLPAGVALPVKLVLAQALKEGLPEVDTLPRGVAEVLPLPVGARPEALGLPLLLRPEAVRAAEALAAALRVPTLALWLAVPLLLAVGQALARAEAVAPALVVPVPWRRVGEREGCAAVVAVRLPTVALELLCASALPLARAEAEALGHTEEELLALALALALPAAAGASDSVAARLAGTMLEVELALAAALAEAVGPQPALEDTSCPQVEALAPARQAGEAGALPARGVLHHTNPVRWAVVRQPRQVGTLAAAALQASSVRTNAPALHCAEVATQARGLSALAAVQNTNPVALLSPRQAAQEVP
jgi:hypothetical protein